MPEDSPPLPVLIFELCLLALGVVLLWRFVLSRAARERLRANPPLLERWQISTPDFFLLVGITIAIAFVSVFAMGLLSSALELTADVQNTLNTAALQVGLVIGLLFGRTRTRQEPPRRVLVAKDFLSGLATFLIAAPIVTVANFLSLELLEWAGIPVRQQDILRIFSETDSVVVLGFMILLAVVLAPISEELLFRSTLFGFFRTRVPRSVALLLPAVIFAALHVNWSNYDGLASFLPLITLAVIFSLAYERTGRIATAIIAHAFFNLHSLLLLFAGVSPT